MHEILIIDDHPITRGGLVALLEAEPGFAVCAQVGTAAEALAVLENAEPDLALVDISLPDRSGLELIKDFKLSRPSMLSLVISVYDENLYAERVLRAGGQGYISKQADPDEIVQAIRRVLGGDVYMSRAIAARLLSVVTGRRMKVDPRDPVSVLTDRELEVFQHLGEGRKTRVIAERLGVSPKTVESHRSNIQEKLRLSDSMGLIRYALHWAADYRG